MTSRALGATLAAALTAAAVSPALEALDGGPDGGPDGGADFCATVEDDCCLDDGVDGEVLALSGCNGGSSVPAPTGGIGGECAFDPEAIGPMGDCSGISVCWPFPNWFYQYPPASGGECGLCLRWCTSLGGCPDGVNADDDNFDFCSSDCPAGSRCWVYDYSGNTLGLCMADCEQDADCSSGICDHKWDICVPRPQACDFTGADSGPEDDGGADAGDGGTFQMSGHADSGCQCDGAAGAPSGGILALIVDAIL
jgi:hypothetical protein